MGHFNAVSVNKKREEATFGGGCKWGEVYEAVNAQGLMAVGGGYHGVGESLRRMDGGRCSAIPEY
jgi:peptide methionine sulfoxide reductase MsrA